MLVSCNLVQDQIERLQLKQAATHPLGQLRSVRAKFSGVQSNNILVSSDLIQNQDIQVSAV
jgi:hypothetical protein